MKYYFKNAKLNDAQVLTVQKAIDSKGPLTLTLYRSQFDDSYDVKLPLTSLQLKKVQLDDPVKLEFHLLQLKEIAKNFNQDIDVDMLAFKRM